MLARYTPRHKVEGERFYTADGYNASRKLLLARRLIEAGVRVVSVSFSDFDTHSKNFPRMQHLVPVVDHALATLVSDLRERGMLDDVTIVAWGEFGRTPRIIQIVGRDQWAASWSVMVGGGGLKGGQAVGKTDRDGVRVDGKAYLPGDIWATVSHALGIPSKTVHRSKRGRPMKLANGGSPIKELIG